MVPSPAPGEPCFQDLLGFGKPVGWADEGRWGGLWRALQSPGAPGCHSPSSGCTCTETCPGCGCRKIPEYTPPGRCQVAQDPCGSGCACVTLYSIESAALFVGEADSAVLGPLGNCQGRPTWRGHPARAEAVCVVMQGATAVESGQCPLPRFVAGLCTHRVSFPHPPPHPVPLADELSSRCSTLASSGQQPWVCTPVKFWGPRGRLSKDFSG